MSLVKRVGWGRCIFAVALTAVLASAVIQYSPAEREIALVIGEPYEAMRKRSSASIDSAIPGNVSFDIPKSDASLRFIDPQFGFVTPPARFFAVIYDNEIIRSVRMSPQIEPLLLDDTLKVVLDLQEQWRQSGWTVLWDDDFPPFADTPDWRAKLRDENRSGKTYWRAGDKYQIMLVVNRFTDDKRPTEERYLMTLEVSKFRGY
ncbi:hypothetical protein [Pseudomonas sp. LB3P31]